MSIDWIPFDVMDVGTRKLVRWIHPGSQQRFLEPFFQQSIQALIAANAAQKLAPLEQLADVAPRKAPAGFIFHVSRCGSTLASRSLAAVSRHIVIAEAGPINQLLLMEGLDQRHKWQLVKGLIHALCGTAQGTACIVKMSSWNLLFLEQIRALFPTTPWTFLYREPGEVLRSLTAEAPNWAGNPTLARLVGTPHSAEGPLMLHALENMFRAPLAHIDRLALPLNYTQLPTAIMDIASHFGLALDALEQQQVARAWQYDAKQSGQVPFVVRGRAPLPTVPGDAMAPLALLYQQWEQYRSERAQPGPMTGDAPAGSGLPARGEPSSAPPREAKVATDQLMADHTSAVRKMAMSIRRDQRLLRLLDAHRLALPDSDLLGNIYRRQGALGAASAEFVRLHANGKGSPTGAIFRAMSQRVRGPARMPESEFAAAPFAILEQFLGSDANQGLLTDAIAKRNQFRPTELQNSDQYGRAQRTNLVTYDLGAWGDSMRALVNEQLALVCERLNMPLFTSAFIQLKIAAYLNGDYFNAHQDNGKDQRDRKISFVYYFNQQPKPYTGGDLLLYDSRFAPRAYVRSLYTRVIPQNDSIIFFPSEYFHEVTPVTTRDPAFAASRFTIAGHIG